VSALARELDRQDVEARTKEAAQARPRAFSGGDATHEEEKRRHVLGCRAFIAGRAGEAGLVWDVFESDCGRLTLVATCRWHREALCVAADILAGRKRVFMNGRSYGAANGILSPISRVSPPKNIGIRKVAAKAGETVRYEVAFPKK